MELTEGHDVVKCASLEATMRAKALANLQFNWYLAAILVFTVIFYVRKVNGNYSDKGAAYAQKPDNEGDATVEMGNHGVERQYFGNGSQSSVDLERMEEAVKLIERC